MSVKSVRSVRSVKSVGSVESVESVGCGVSVGPGAVGVWLLPVWRCRGYLLILRRSWLEEGIEMLLKVGLLHGAAA